MDRVELAQLAWSIIDRCSADPEIADQLTPQQWLELGRYMASIVVAEQRAKEAA